MTLDYTNYTTPQAQLQLQLHLHYTNYTTLQLQLHYATTTTALHHATSSSCAEVTIQWIRSAIRDLQQPTSPIGFLFLKLPPLPCAVLLVALLDLSRTYNVLGEAFGSFLEVWCSMKGIKAWAPPPYRFPRGPYEQRSHP